MDFKVTIPNLSQLLAKFSDAPEITASILARTMSLSEGVLAEYTVQGTVPWRTGFLTQHFSVDYPDNTTLTWGPRGVSYAPYVEFGTGIYGTGPGATGEPILILPKKGKALMWPGAWHPVRAVLNPGQQPNPFMERILSDSQPRIIELFENALTQIVQEMAS